MKRSMEAIRGLGLALLVMATVVGFETAQAQQSTTDALKALDQVIEQNKKLEQQNRELMDQVNILRQRLATPPGSAAPTPAVATAASVPSQLSPPKPPEEVPRDARNTASEASNGETASFGEFNPGKGFTVAQGEYGTLNFSGYIAARYLNQMPGDQTATDHLGRPITVTPRNDFQFHRVMLFAQGWLFSPKFNYSTFVWTVQDTNQVAVGGALTYKFDKHFVLGIGWNAYPGTQSLQGSHPYWVSYDRVMGEEFFRPFFSQGVFGQGIIVPRLEYRWMIGNNSSGLYAPASKLDRKLSGGGAVTWLPTTGEFGPRGAFGDYERHQKLATRFNLAYTYSPENRESAVEDKGGNTTLRLADSLNVFDPGTFGDGITVQKVNYKLLSAAAGMKYKGFWLQGEGYLRRLDNFVATARVPINAVRDTGFYVQMSHMLVPNRIEGYASTSYVFSDYGRPKEFIVGGNYYPWNTRNLRLNVQLINVDHSPVSSSFGFYSGKITGQVLAIGFTALY